nr:putative heat shock protein 70 family [Tanacetum cinerariifolium]
MILVKMKETADAYLGKVVKNVVVTVPAYFNDLQRQATKDGGAIVGLNVIRIINKPNADAIAYGLENKVDIIKTMNMLVFDFGGGTFDVSLLKIAEGENFKVKDELDCLHEGINFSLRFTRAKFEELNMDAFDKCIKTIETCLNDANMKKSCVNEVILVGGSTRILKVQCMLQEFFDGKQLYKSVNPDEAVARGAAIMAAKLSGNIEKSYQDLVFLDVTPLSLGIEKWKNVMEIMIQRNTPIPAQMTKGFTTSEDNQTLVSIKVYQGVPLVNECLKTDADGIITVTAEILSTGKRDKLVITNENGRLTKEEIDKMVLDAEKYKLEDQEYKKNTDAYIALEDCLYKLKHKRKIYNEHPENLKKSTPAIGIDLGTTYSCVAVWKHGRIEIIPNDQGNRTTPSIVAFTDAECLIGDGTKNQVAMNPANTIFG